MSHGIGRPPPAGTRRSARSCVFMRRVFSTGVQQLGRSSIEDTGGKPRQSRHRAHQQAAEKPTCDERLAHSLSDALPPLVHANASTQDIHSSHKRPSDGQASTRQVPGLIKVYSRLCVEHGRARDPGPAAAGRGGAPRRRSACATPQGVDARSERYPPTLREEVLARNGRCRSAFCAELEVKNTLG
ncbi:hypothetical protein PsYK624_093060 [Phanerochaete sordida]|uniref:Uncharacterized protein n=1 Tax=Phanerochaete sordida TaxID=48140 RepID=A0A9P3LGJ2_9APHY|nr:hypothetical protein PsYK624_093060 [Phanerochaete sordida]